MKLIKNAFTLAEVLVVLAILGVVAALTMPTMQMNANKATVGPSLAKAISTLENANELFLADTNARSIHNVATTGNYLETLVNEDYLKLIPGRLEAGTQYSLFPGNDPEEHPVPGLALNNYFAGSDNIAYFQNGGMVTMNPAPPSNEYNGRYYEIFVDINSPNKGPNMLGKDLFRLFVDGKGSVIPDGGNKAITYFGMNGVYQGCTRDGVTDGGYSCAGSIVDNGYKVVYPY